MENPFREIMRKLGKRRSIPNMSSPEMERAIRGFTPLSGEASALIVARTVTVEECPWLENDVEEGRVVFRYTGQTYGACDLDYGLPVTETPNKLPYFELPREALLGDVDQPPV